MPERYEPYKSITSSTALKNTALEVPSLVYRYPFILAERSSQKEEYGRKWLKLTEEHCQRNGSGIFTGQQIVLDKKLGAGFSSSVFQFHDEERQWVMKVGYSQAISSVKLSHASNEYTRAYQEQFYIQREVYSERLPFLIPSPQEAHSVIDEANQDMRTIIVQPFIQGILGPRVTDVLNEDQLLSLLDELMLFDMLSRKLQREYALSPDVVPTFGNLEITNMNGEPHYILLDNGLIDKQAPGVYLRMFNEAAYNWHIAIEVMKIKNSLKKRKLYS